MCGDIAQTTMALLPDSSNVLCWELGMGHTTNNRLARQSEMDQANAANADCFIGIHVDGGAPSGGGSYKYADSPASATLTFTGTGIDWIATKGYTQGKAKLILDGGAPVTVDAFEVWESPE